MNQHWRCVYALGERTHCATLGDGVTQTSEWARVSKDGRSAFTDEITGDACTSVQSVPGQNGWATLV